MPLEPGQLVTPQVRLVRKLKAGGMGSVWVADQIALKTQVAVKFIGGNHAHKPELAARFAREATAAASIKSPHVVQIHDHGITSADDPYMVMELLEGEDLATRLKDRGRMRLEDVVRIVQQVARVLAKAHALSIVHRDVKPSNVFLLESEGDGDIFVKLLDFGVAKLRNADESDLTGTGVMMGTMVYMSPEQLLDARNVDFPADLWSLAVVAYYAITGALPFDDDNGVGALVLALDRGQYAPPSSLRPELPPAVDAWFARAFKRRPEDRFPSAKEMASELAAAVGTPEAMLMLRGSSTALARVSVASLPEIPPPPVVSPPTPVPARRPLVLLLAIGVIAVAGVAGLSFVAWGPSSTQADAAAQREGTTPSASASTSVAPPADPTASSSSEPAASEAPPAVDPPPLASGIASSPRPAGSWRWSPPSRGSAKPGEKDYGF